MVYSVQMQPKLAHRPVAVRLSTMAISHVAQHVVRTGGVDFVGLGRMVLAYPDLPADVLERGEIRTKQLCRTFSDCTTAPRNGMISGCFPLDPYYKGMPIRKELIAIKIGKARGS